MIKTDEMEYQEKLPKGNSLIKRKFCNIKKERTLRTHFS